MGKELLYVAHRREDHSLLNKIQQDLGFRITRFDYPIEYQIAFIGPRPAILASFISSALENCRQIFKDSMKIVSFRLDLKESPKKQEVEKVYDNYHLLLSENFIVETDY